ncbi:hypothetical protein [Planomonospora sp. ID82291]|nr:hypothetical protein [Planomonospora sp. ID82291]
MAEKTSDAARLAEAIRTADRRDRRAEGMRRGRGHRVPAHRPRRVPGRG